MTKPFATDLNQQIEFDSSRPVSKLLHDSEKSRVVLFCLEGGQMLAPHESTSEVVFVGIDGSATVMLGEKQIRLDQHCFIVCPPNVPHGIKAAKRAAVLATIAPRPA